ncbi:MAG: alkyl hydroperoxide reductase subunit F [Candidatus Marinimicrobia bacterium]|nr:alkyl hydroperoxide reductase subunit F [Candidatus Neomarinimicrobiota bacterium]|tara:strand:- start:256 stop:1854 length:1599 start_codon:yes stop_codon:yes gene_type:complete
MRLTPEITQSLSGYMKNLEDDITIVLQTGEHDKRDELVTFLQEVCATSEKLLFEEKDLGTEIRSPITFSLLKGGVSSGIKFTGIPGGHEFNSFILATLQLGGSDLKLDSGIKSLINDIEDKLRFEIFISLDCHICPDVVQALNKFAILNENIACEMIDGGLFPEEVEEKNIQGVPTIFLNGSFFSSGRTDTSKIINKLKTVNSNIGKRTQINLPLQDTVVIGGGPAGISSAIYLARKGLKVALVSENIGGQVKETLGIENYISVIETTGERLTGDMHSHLKEYEVTVKEHFRVEGIDKGKIKSVKLSSGEIINTKTIIIATGANWRELGVPGEKENLGNGVAYCPHCDGPFFKGKDVSVVGGGNSGIEAALDLSGIAKSVTVIEFMPDLKADKILVEKAEEKENIKILTNFETKKILSEAGKVNGMEVLDRTSNEKTTISLQGVFVQIGLIPNSQFLKGTVELNDYGEIIVDHLGETSEPGIYACGDVTTIPYKQIIISMGDGAKTALSVSDYLMKSEEFSASLEKAETIEA